MLDLARIEVGEEFPGFRHVHSKTREFRNTHLLLRNMPITLSNVPLGFL
ncbi:hypothetical protein [Bradyrhizobium ottawaense]